MTHSPSSPETESLIENLLQACVDYETCGPNSNKQRRLDLEKAKQAVRDAIGHAQRPAVTDEMVERAWAGIVGQDIAAICHNASVVRGDIRAALEAALSGSSTVGPAQCQHEPVAWQFRQRSAVGKGPQSSLPWCDWICIEREDYERYVREPNKLVQVRPLFALADTSTMRCTMCGGAGKHRAGCINDYSDTSTGRKAPASCPHCYDKTDCSNVDICNAIEPVTSPVGWGGHLPGKIEP